MKKSILIGGILAVSAEPWLCLFSRSLTELGHHKVKSELGYPIKARVLVSGVLKVMPLPRYLELRMPPEPATIASSSAGFDGKAALKCNEGDALSITATTTGYLSTTTYAITSYKGNTGDGDNTITIYAPYTLKVIAMTNELGTSVMPATTL